MRMWDKNLILVTPAEYKDLPNGITLTSIQGDEKIKGLDYIDDDTRFGMIAWGFKTVHHRLFIAMGKVGIGNEVDVHV